MVGAPMSYWGGAWREGEGDNPMRYAGGLLGGTWLSSLAADIGDGKFDGAYLVQNFENLNPANTFWDKYYNVFANIDTEHGALPRVRALVGRLLPHESRGDRVDHAEPLRRQQGVVGHASRRSGRSLRPAPDQGADRAVRVAGRQHHAAAAGVQLGGRRVWQHRGNQGARPGDRRPDARGHRPPRHLRFRQGRQEGARADRVRAEVDRSAAAGPLWNADRGEQGRRQDRRTT